MRRIFYFGIILFFICADLSAQLTVSGLLDSTVSFNAGAGDMQDFSFGIEEFANIRFQSRIRDHAVVYGAVNLVAASGSFAAAAKAQALHGNESPLAVTSYTAGDNFIGGIELERLYFRLNGEHLDFDGGLMRLPFGYGQVWKSSDFLNPRNPLKPDARPRGILAASLTWFPIDELKLLAFYTAPRLPFSSDSSGSLFGLSIDRHWTNASLQALYSYETPAEITPQGIHRAGLSFKADIEVGIYLDALYTYNHEARTEWDGLSFSAGLDYSFLKGNLIVLAEYLYNGETSSTAFGYGGDFSNNHYLSTSLTLRFNDFTSMSMALISCIDDISFTSVIGFNHELFQGATLILSAQVPLDRDLFTGDGNHGELGPIRPDKYQPHTEEDILIGRYGSYFNFTARVRLRF